jgi:hypothetical protein
VILHGDIFRRFDSVAHDSGVSKTNGWSSSDPLRDLERKKERRVTMKYACRRGVNYTVFKMLVASRTFS